MAFSQEMDTLACGHRTPSTGRFCAHLLADEDASFHVRFTGRGLHHDLVGGACAKAGAQEDALVAVCEACMQARISSVFDVEGVIGRPEVRSRPTTLRFEHREHRLPALTGAEIRAVAALEDSLRPRWLALTERGELLRVDLDDGGVTRLTSIGAEGLELAEPLAVHASPCGRFAAVVNVKGQRGVVVELESGAVTLRLDRGRYHIEHCAFSVAFFRDGESTRLVHATAWNRLDLSDPATGQLLTPRDTTWRRKQGEPRTAHELDYFHCGLTVSPDGEWLVDDGWVWTPVGVLRSFNLRRWARENVWESEDGPSVKELRSCSYFWDAPRCFVGERTLAAWGFGGDDLHMVDAAMLFDVESGKLLRWFAGAPRGEFRLALDYLLTSAKGHGTSIWDVETGERLHHDPDFLPWGHHRGARRFLTVVGGGVLRESWLLGEG